MQVTHSVLFEARQRIAFLTIDRPEAMHALNPAVLACLAPRLERIKADPRSEEVKARLPDMPTLFHAPPQRRKK